MILPEHLPGKRDLGDAALPSLTANEAFLELPFHQSVAALERESIRRALAETGGNRAEAPDARASIAACSIRNWKSTASPKGRLY